MIRRLLQARYTDPGACCTDTTWAPTALRQDGSASSVAPKAYVSIGVALIGYLTASGSVKDSHWAMGATVTYF